ncbi:MAG: BMP family ABC transporter substrate-binding protein [Dethiobacter sp.]|jgi:basic membrane protein A|nr:BMP family ABC transporter substrate-binding protein [Dethiobacter sp.]
MKKMSKKRLLLTVLILAITLVISACGRKSEVKQPTEQPKEEAPKLRMVMVTNQAGVGDGGFNDMAWAGFKLAEKELGAVIHVIEPGEQANFTPSLAAAAEQGYDMVVAVGFLLVDSLKEIADLYPDTNFVIIDGMIEKPNVASVLFKENEAAYLAGIVAAKMTKTNIIGFIGGMETPPVLRFESGWKAGIMTVNPDIRINFAFVGAFNNPGKAKEQALALYDSGADVILEVGGLSGLGVIEAAKDAKKWFVACDMDKSALGEGAQLTAAMKRIDNAVLEMAKNVQNGTFKAGIYNLGLKENAVGLPENTAKIAGPEIMKIVEVLTEKIIKGELVIPSDREQAKNFTPPKL